MFVVVDMVGGDGGDKKSIVIGARLHKQQRTTH